MLIFALLLGGSAACSPESGPESEQAGQLAEAVTVGDIMQRAASVTGYSYWWGHGRWRWDGAQHGSCSGGCPDCSHSGAYGADCSGFVAKAWQVPGPSDIATDSHPYSTYHFRHEATHWKQINRSDSKAGDAMVYRSGGGGHIFLYEKADPWGSMWSYECKGCSAGCVHNIRTAGSNYVAIRRNNVTGGGGSTSGGGGGEATCEENCAKVGCKCVNGKCSGGFCEGNGCTALQTENCAKVGCTCVDGKCDGGYCAGNGCTALQTEDCGAFGCACVDGKCSGGYCPGTGCTADEASNCADVACNCVDHKCSGGFACSANGNGCTAKETTDCGKYGCDCYDHACSGGFCN
jgi:hypothetical protein